MVKRRPSSEEERLWRQAMQNTRPLRSRKTVVAPDIPAAPAANPASNPALGPASNPAPAAHPPMPPSILPHPSMPASTGSPPGVRAGIAGLDRRTAERLRRGQLAIEATLDLHGYRLEEARRALSRFIATSQASGRRCVLIVTGKGAPGSKETIRALVPRWLADGGTSARVLAIAPARPKDGGGGALYILLRKHKREPAGVRR